MVEEKILTDPSLLIILATSPTGLGHLRVVDALYHGLPKTASPILLGAQDPVVSGLYRYISNHVFARTMMEQAQVPPYDVPFARISRKLLRSRNKYLYRQLKAMLTERITVPKLVLFIAPHAILGHQIGSIRERFEKETGVKTLLVVQVTDDSPQPIWYVHDADLLFVPSLYTKEHLENYARKVSLPTIPVLVSAYPISPLFSEETTESAFAKRMEQMAPESDSTIHVTVPVSGAAVGTTFLSDYLQAVHHHSPRFLFHVITREAPYTQHFIETVNPLPYVQLLAATHDRTTVANYEQVFKTLHPALEITKPSEQAFKALATPRQRGGVIMLFAKPIGGQEYDNLHFLRNHGFMPRRLENQQLWDLAIKKEPVPAELLKKAHHWRAICLPDEAVDAAMFTLWCLQQGIFAAMMLYSQAEEAEALQSNGVEQFWSRVAKLVEENKGYLS